MSSGGDLGGVPSPPGLPLSDPPRVTGRTCFSDPPPCFFDPPPVFLTPHLVFLTPPALFF